MDANNPDETLVEIGTGGRTTSKIQHSPESLPMGTKLLQYRIDQVLGQGGFGITYRAHDSHLDMAVAIKEFFPRDFLVRTPEGLVQLKSDLQKEQFEVGKKRFLSEAQTLARFKHANIIRVNNFFENYGTAYMVMEFEDGESLSRLFKSRRHWSEEQLRAWTVQLLDGLQVMHDAGIIHRDIKPANIYIRNDASPVLLDFGAARQAIGEYSRTLTVVLTPGYAPLEQYQNSSKRQGPWTDIYALGAVLYTAITNRVPDDATSRSSSKVLDEPDPLQPAIHAGKGDYSQLFLKSIDHAMKMNYRDRPQSAREWQAELEKGNRDWFQQMRNRIGL